MISYKTSPRDGQELLLQRALQPTAWHGKRHQLPSYSRRRDAGLIAAQADQDLKILLGGSQGEEMLCKTQNWGLKRELPSQFPRVCMGGLLRLWYPQSHFSKMFLPQLDAKLNIIQILSCNQERASIQHTLAILPWVFVDLVNPYWYVELSYRGRWCTPWRWFPIDDFWLVNYSVSTVLNDQYVQVTITYYHTFATIPTLMGYHNQHLHDLPILR